MVINERFDGDEEVGGDSARVVTAALDKEVFFDQLPPELHTVEYQALLNQDVWDGVEVRFWIAPGDARLLKFAVISIGREDGLALQLTLDYATPVSVPASVPSMDYEEGRKLSREGEEGGAELLQAIGRYHGRTGEYPPAITPEVLSEDIAADAWPVNPFSNRPIAQSEEAGDFGYVRSSTGIEFWVNGWDDREMSYDSARGPIRPQTPIPTP
jgi:hypothetical protein